MQTTNLVYRHRPSWYLRRTFAYLVLLAGAVLMFIPFAYMISTSLKTQLEAFKFPPALLPNPVVWSNYIEIWSRAPLGYVALNSIKISLLSTMGQVVSCSLAGFAFARLKFKGKNLLFAFILATLMIPSQVTLIPQFLLYRELDWINTHAPLIVPAWFGGGFGIFLVRQFFMTVPQELADAAKVDGCNPFRIYWQIFMPLARPVLATFAILTFLNSWNDLLGPLIYLRDSDLMTFPVALTSFAGHYNVDLPLLMAASVVSIIPTLILVLTAQQYFVQGIVLSGIKM